MKGIIAISLKRLVKKEYGLEKWYDILERSGFSKYELIKASDDLDDAKFLNIIASTCAVLDITLEQAADAFGDYWVNEYAPEVYSVYYKNAKTAKELILNMNNVHKKVVLDLENARPPTFEFEWKNDNTLLINYKSDRNLAILMIGLLKGVSKYYNEDLKIRLISDNTAEVVFN
ncbi:MAG: heme NO-binding domain-containing protein [Candidatus Sabulitectum sp.]|nr:heme NO-binding domain-containing protein [Candidatus Sabulitectum sp.]